ncbi:MAG: FKBP-type peptidyl-prolyl cis-trans isomerase [Proteobacteria bacterium]|uniref:Peptidyl-prolyl cis-trans isomerase n=1 Tax=Candidatus Avisuccinivibrio stercorigallinarum TaxID=2840704 RepID=A0A9D9DD38_9GAMM|nr:FKBP-type peptidyl-prolyl cis-trans isomerase [Candidatus Avisuccinivibrio stercorigallinarum]
MLNFKHKGFVLSLLASSVLLAVGCNDSTAASESKPAAAAPAPAVTAESSFDDKVAYSIGASVGGYIAQMVDAQGEYLGNIKTELIEQGFKDALLKQNSLTPEQVEETLKALDQKVMEQMQAKAKAEAETNLEAGNKFLEENAKKEGVVTTASGLQYKVITEGTGKAPTKDDIISVKYKGTTIDGKTFDEQKEPVDFPLANMIAGWVEGLQLMKEGSVYEFYIPASLAYGENGAGDIIKPNSVLVFNVELVKIKTPGDLTKPAPAPAEAAGGAQAEQK